MKRRQHKKKLMKRILNAKYERLDVMVRILNGEFELADILPRRHMTNTADRMHFPDEMLQFKRTE